jgi:hypothetical protein
MRLMVSTPPSDRPLSAAIADYARVAQRLVEPTMRHAMITEAAYYRAQRRGFAPGHELDDWLAAEIEVNEMLVNALLK